MPSSTEPNCSHYLYIKLVSYQKYNADWMNEIYIVIVKVISMFLYKTLYRYMVSLSDQEILSWKSWAVVIGVQLLLFPVFLPPLSFLFLWWYSSYAPDQNLHNEGVINHGVEGRWINSKTKVIFEFVYVSIQNKIN